MHAHASGDEDRAAELLQRVGLAFIGSGGSPPSVGGSTCSVRTSSPGTGARPDGGVDRGAGRIPSRPIAGPRRPIGSHSPARPCSGRRRSIVRGHGARDHVSRGADAMHRAAQLAVREESESSQFRSSALTYLGLATLIRGDEPAADVLFAEASEVGLRIGGMTAASLALAERSLIATSQGDRAAADEYAQRLVRSCMTLTSTSTSLPGRCRHRLSSPCERETRSRLASSCPPRNDSGRSSPGGSRRSRSRPGSSSLVHVGLSDAPGARTLLAEVDEILTHRPDLGILTEQASEFRKHVGSVQSRRSPGPSTLTVAELRLLAFLPTHLSFREIGARLYVSPNTVKTRSPSIASSSLLAIGRRPGRP